MHLLPCNRPSGPLEPAPATSLSDDSVHHGPGEVWDGYWGGDDGQYYARCVRADGREHWYRVADEPRARWRRATRVLPLRPPAAAPFARRVLAVGARGRATMLVGTWRRRSSARRATGSGR